MKKKNNMINMSFLIHENNFRKIKCKKKLGNVHFKYVSNRYLCVGKLFLFCVLKIYKYEISNYLI